MHVPGWHEATKELQRQGQLQMLGIIEEQHPDRAQLFMQWKQMGWPVLVDSYNLLEAPYVPITVAIDEHGIVRHIGMPMQDARRLAEQFLKESYERPVGDAPPTRLPEVEKLKVAAEQQKTGAAWRAYGDAVAVWGGREPFANAIAAYEQALKLNPHDELAEFRLGVAYRMRYDSDRRRAQDFQHAVTHWSRALEMNPNQYIFRRRIQQYGPRLSKPYPFYDWVAEARREIRARGLEPATVTVEPMGAEIAQPERSFPQSDVVEREPDPQEKILRDGGQFIRTETTVVPPVIDPGGAARVHIVFRPNWETKAHWNNEVNGLVLWVNPPEGWPVDHRAQTLANPPQSTSQEIRRVEFEVRAPPNAAGRVTIPAYALYYVCEDVNGICMYRRQDLRIPLEVRGPARNISPQEK